MAPLEFLLMGKPFTIDAYFKGKNVQYWDDAYFKRKNVQDWEVNAQSSILNAETLDVKPLKKVQRCEPKEIYIVCLER